MTIYVGLLRGINVGGRHRLPMARCRSAVEGIGATDVVTYIQSGNVIFEHPRAGDEDVLAGRLASALSAAAGFDVPVVLRTAEAWTALADRTPFDVPDPTKVHVGFLPDRPDASTSKALAAIDQTPFAPARFVLDGREVFLHLPDGIGRSKLASRVSRALPDATLRNWRTVAKIAALAGSRSMHS